MKINNDPKAVLMQEQYKAKAKEMDSMKPRFDDLLKKKDREALKKVSQEFEELFVGMVLKRMRASVPKSGFMNDSNELKIYEDMLDEAYAKNISEKGSFGIADMIMRSFEPYLDKEDREESEETGFDIKA